MAEPRHSSYRDFTFGDYLLWPEGKRWELIDGVAYDMTPAPSRRHQEISMELAGQLFLFLRGKSCRVYAAPFDVRLPDRHEADEEIHTVVQPDISVVCDRAKLDDRGCRGAPDLIIEIVSPSSSHLDYEKKTALYEKHGVREYWIVDPLERLLTVRLLDDNGRYEVVRSGGAAGAVSVSVLPGLQLDLDSAMRTAEP